MGVIIIILGIMLIIAHKNKGKKKKNRTTWQGKSDWNGSVMKVVSSLDGSLFTIIVGIIICFIIFFRWRRHYITFKRRWDSHENFVFFLIVCRFFRQ